MKNSFLILIVSVQSVTSKALKALKCFYKANSVAHRALELRVNSHPHLAPPEVLSFPNSRGTKTAFTNMGKSKERGKEWF